MRLRVMFCTFVSEKLWLELLFNFYLIYGKIHLILNLIKREYGKTSHSQPWKITFD